MTIEKLINDLEKNASTLKKAELISEFTDKTLLKEVLFYTLNPYYNYYIKKLPVMKTGKNDFEPAWTVFRIHLDGLNGRIFTGHDAIARTVKILETVKPEVQEIFKRILFRDLRCSVSDKISNKVFPGLVPEFKVQLANKYDPDKKYKNTKWAVNRKLDGLRCVFINGKLFTRNGKEVVGFEHIVEELKTLGKYDLIDGELYSHDIAFQEIQGYVLRNKNVVESDKQKIFYNIFVLLNKNTTTQEIVDKVSELSKRKNFRYLKFVEYEIIDNDFDKIQELNEKYVSEKYEGVMLRSMDVPYDWKRSDALLKYKSFKESDLKIIDMVEGNGKYQGMLGKFVCEGEIEGHQVKTEVGSGFDDAQREEFWKNKKQIIGKLVEVKYQNLTHTNGSYSLRFPIFRKFKLDRK